MRNATVVANLLAAVILAGTGVYVQASFAEMLSLTGRISIGLTGLICMLVHVFVVMKDRPPTASRPAELPGS